MSRDDSSVVSVTCHNCGDAFDAINPVWNELCDRCVDASDITKVDELERSGRGLPIQKHDRGWIFRNQYFIERESGEWVLRIGSGLVFRGQTVGAVAERAVRAGY